MKFFFSGKNVEYATSRSYIELGKKFECTLHNTISTELNFTKVL